MQNIPVASNATAWTSPSGETYTLVFHESLIFGDSMNNSLINPNQLQSHGIPVWNNPYNPTRSMDIEDGDFHIPFHSKGSTIYFESHYPSDIELETCPYIELTSEKEWDP